MRGTRAATVTTDADAPPSRVRLPAPEWFDNDAGDAVVLRTGTGTETAAYHQHDPALDGETVVVPPDVADALGVDDGDVVVVEPVTVTSARSLVVAPVAQLSVRGGDDAVREALAGRPIVAGDTVAVSLLGGTFEVPFRVTETASDGPVTVDGTTDIDLRSGPAPPVSGRRRTTPVPAAAVGGYDATVSTCRSAIARPLRDADAYRVDGRSAAAGVLVEGQAGVGKTHHVRHAAWLANATIRRVDCARLASASAERVADRLDEEAREAAAAAPVVIHLDELDALAADGGATPTATLVGAWIEELTDRTDVVVVGEARDGEGLAAVLTRGGRLSRRVAIPSPSAGDRAAILRVLTRGLDLGAEVELTAVGDRTLGYVAADLVSFRARIIEAALARTDGTAGSQTLTAADVDTALAETTPSAAPPVGSVPSISFDDIGGLADVKRELTRAIEWPLTYADSLSRLGVDSPAGVLLYGPPGTGKTMLARAVASTTDANFLTVDGPELLNKYVGESERRVRQLFERARDSAPAVVFFDELDALGSARTDDGGSAAPARVVSQLLTELDGLQPREQITVIGATNRPDRIDDALTRPGRFDRLVEVPLPDEDARREILRIHARDRPVEDLDVDRVVDRTAGYSGSDIAAVLQEACLLALEAALGDAAVDTDAMATSATDLVVGREDVARALDRIEPSLSPEARERYAAFGRDDPDGG